MGEKTYGKCPKSGSETTCLPDPFQGQCFGSHYLWQFWIWHYPSMNRLCQNHQKTNWVTILLSARLHQIATPYLHQFWSVFLVKWGVPKNYLLQPNKMMLTLIYPKEEAFRDPIYSVPKKRVPMAGRKNQIAKVDTYLEQRRWVVILEVIIYLGRGDLINRQTEVICSEQNKMGSTGRSFIPYKIKHVCSHFFKYIIQLSIPICSQTTVCTHYIYSIAKKIAQH